VFTKIAVGTDGSETAAKAMETALDLAERYQARLLIFSAYEPDPRPPAREQDEPPEDAQWMLAPHADVDATLAEATKWAADRGLESTAVAREGEPAAVICSLAAEFDTDLLVIGNKGMQRRILGSVPNTILHHAPCSVVLAKTT
jgi:nucleotide-binding universal stress UspA family protein